MATLVPNPASIRSDAGLYREIDVLERLQLSLPDSYEIFHSVGWHSIHNGDDRYGEIDIVVLAPTGNLLLIEVKAGQLIQRNGEIFKLYSGQERNVARQVKIQYSAMLSRLNEARLHPHVANCLVLPDYQLGDESLVAFPKDRIVDATDFEQLGSRIRDFLDVPTDKGENVAAMHRFLSNEFRVSPNLHNLGETLRNTSIRLADGLATWVPRINSPSGVIRVQATAGSGKTQLALQLLGDAVNHGQRALYVCYNRTLADHIAQLAPTRAIVASFHELCVEHHRRSKGEPDFNAPETFQTVTDNYCAAAAEFPPRYDLIVIDEGQDFEPAWVASLLPQLNPEGRLYLLEDEAQRLYARDGFNLSDAVTLSCNDNFRSPRYVCDMINALGLTTPAITSCSPYIGDVPGFRVFDSSEQMLKRTEEAIVDLLARGFPLAEIAILSWHGLKKSALLQSNQIGKFATRHFTGHYSRDGEQIWSHGDVLTDSIYRFKGQSAQAVVLTELDFTELGETEQRKLFVGLTRARLSVEMVLARPAEQCLIARLSE